MENRFVVKQMGVKECRVRYEFQVYCELKTASFEKAEKVFEKKKYRAFVKFSIKAGVHTWIFSVGHELSLSP